MSHQRVIISLAEKNNAWVSLLLLLSSVLLGGGFIQLIASIVFEGHTVQTTDFLHGHITTVPRTTLLCIQIFANLGTFLIGPLLYFCYIEQKDIRALFQYKGQYAYPALITLGLMSGWMVMNTVFIVVNTSIKLPSVLQNFEAWAQAQEVAIKNLILYLSNAQTPLEVGLVFVALTIIPAIGEEFVFRGVLQNILHKIFNNYHGAIFVSALIFSIVHFQFYGLMPRTVLGALFGYLYWWTKDLTFPILAHFFNNAITLTLLLIYHQAFMDYDLQQILWWVGPSIPLWIILHIKLKHYLTTYLQQHTLQATH